MVDDRDPLASQVAAEAASAKRAWHAPQLLMTEVKLTEATSSGHISDNSYTFQS